MNNSLFLQRAAKSFSSHLVLFIFLYGFIVKSFLLCFSFQSQHSHLVMQQLLGHLDANSKNSATVRAGIVEVLLEAAAIAASGSVGKLSISTHACIFLYLFYTVKWILIIVSVLQVPQFWRSSTPCCDSYVWALITSWPARTMEAPTSAPRSSKLTRSGSCRRLSSGPLVSGWGHVTFLNTQKKNGSNFSIYFFKFCIQVHLQTLCQHTRGQRSCSLLWARSLCLEFIWCCRPQAQGKSLQTDSLCASCLCPSLSTASCTDILMSDRCTLLMSLLFHLQARGH